MTLLYQLPECNHVLPPADRLLSWYPMVILKTSQLIQYITDSELTRDEAVYTWIHQKQVWAELFFAEIQCL